MKYLCLVYYNEQIMKDMSQQQWDALNREFAFRFSGFLCLMNATGGYDKDLPREIYSLGSIRRGDSIGRPSRHDRRKSLESGGTR